MSQQESNSLFFGDCFRLWTPCDLSSDEIAWELLRAKIVADATNDLLDGTISVRHFFEITESADLDMDSYLEEVTHNVAEYLGESK